MGRPTKVGLDYFTLDTQVEDKIKLIESLHGLTGFAIWVKLLQKIYAHGYFIDWKKENELLFSSEVNVDINSINVIINDMLKFNIFNKNLYDNYQILTSRGVQKRYFDACKRRNSVEAIEEFFLLNSVNEYNNLVFVSIMSTETDKQSRNNSVNDNKNSVNVRKSTQSRVEYSREVPPYPPKQNVNIMSTETNQKKKDDLKDWKKFLDEN